MGLFQSGDCLVRRAGEYGQRTAARGLLPAVHAALHAQRVRQGRPTVHPVAAEAPKTVFAMEPRESALSKAEQVAVEMESRKLREVAKRLREGIDETTAYLLDDHPVEHRRRIPHQHNDRTTEPGNPQENPRGRPLPVNSMT